MKKPSKLDKKWQRKIEELFDRLSMKKSPNPMRKNEEKIEDENKYELFVKKLSNNWGHIKS